MTKLESNQPAKGHAPNPKRSKLPAVAGAEIHVTGELFDLNRFSRRVLKGEALDTFKQALDYFTPVFKQDGIWREDVAQKSVPLARLRQTIPGLVLNRKDWLHVQKAMLYCSVSGKEASRSVAIDVPEFEELAFGLILAFRKMQHLNREISGKGLEQPEDYACIRKAIENGSIHPLKGELQPIEQFDATHKLKFSEVIERMTDIGSHIYSPKPTDPTLAAMQTLWVQVRGEIDQLSKLGLYRPIQALKARGGQKERKVAVMDSIATYTETVVPAEKVPKIAEVLEIKASPFVTYVSAPNFSPDWKYFDKSEIPVPARILGRLEQVRNWTKSVTEPVVAELSERLKEIADFRTTHSREAWVGSLNINDSKNPNRLSLKVDSIFGELDKLRLESDRSDLWFHYVEPEALIRVLGTTIANLNELKSAKYISGNSLTSEQVRAIKILGNLDPQYKNKLSQIKVTGVQPQECRLEGPVEDHCYWRIQEKFEKYPSSYKDILFSPKLLELLQTIITGSNNFSLS